MINLMLEQLKLYDIYNYNGKLELRTNPVKFINYKLIGKLREIVNNTNENMIIFETDDALHFIDVNDIISFQTYENKNINSVKKSVGFEK